MPRGMIPALMLLALLGAADPVDRPYGRAAPPPKPDGAVRLATYNVENLFDHDDDPALTGRIDDMLLAATDERCHALAETIRMIDADVVALQEVESLDTLRWFRDTYLPEAGYEHLSSLDAGYFRGVECSVLSRYEITAERVWPGAALDVPATGPEWAEPPDDTPLAFRRSPLMVDLRIDSYDLTLVALHHKAARGFDHQREAEALKILELIETRVADDPDRNVVVLGDFNAAPWDKSVRAYLEAGFVDVLAHRATHGPHADLFKTHQSGRVIDYVLMNGAAFGELVPGSAFVYGTPVPAQRGDERPADYASDHFPVVVDIVPDDR